MPSKEERIGSSFRKIAWTAIKGILLVLALAAFALTITPLGTRIIDRLLPIAQQKPHQTGIAEQALQKIDCEINAENINEKIFKNYKKICDDIQALKEATNTIKFETKVMETRLNDTYSMVEAVGLSAGLFGVLITMTTIFFALKESERVKDALHGIEKLNVEFKENTKEWEEAKRLSNSAKDSAYSANTEATKAIKNAHLAANTAQSAIDRSRDALRFARDAQDIAETAKYDAKKAAKEAVKDAINKAEEAINKATKAEEAAAQAQSDARYEGLWHPIPEAAFTKTKNFLSTSEGETICQACLIEIKNDTIIIKKPDGVTNEEWQNIIQEHQLGIDCQSFLKIIGQKMITIEIDPHHTQSGPVNAISRRNH